MSSSFGVVVPVYNEPRLAQLLERFDFSKFTVVVADDGSSDGSTDIARRYPVTILKAETRTGVGNAIRLGLVFLKEKGYRVAVVMAGNGKDDPADIVRLTAALEDGADYVQGSRYLQSVMAKGTPLRRRVITRTVALMWSVRFCRRLTDVTNGFRAYRLTLLDHPDIDLSQPWLNRYELEYYLHYKVLTLGFRYTEVPVWKRYPTDGQPTSKIRLLHDGWSLIRPLVLLSLRLRR